MGNNCTLRRSVQVHPQVDAKQASKFSKEAVSNQRMSMQRMQNVLLIWLDNTIDENNADCSNTIKQLKRVVDNVITFTDRAQCFKFIQTMKNNKVYIVVSGSLGKYTMPYVHDMSQVNTFFIFCNNQECHIQWAKEWPKIKGVSTDITSICEALKRVVYQCEQDDIPISFVASNKKLDQLDPSFMYTQILKEILLTINFEDKHIKEFTTHCRDIYADNEHDLHNIEKLEREYHDRSPIWWYTYQYFLCSMLNQALRLMNVDMIVRMGFFINDLHRDIQRLHSEQVGGKKSDETFTVYRGQGVSKKEFTEMTKTKGGLLSFNNFLSTSKNLDVGLCFAPQVPANPDLVGVLFVISINPTHSTTPFASIKDVSYFETENEVLFSMHTIFRIRDIKPMDENNHLYQVNLILTNDKDQDLRTLTDSIRQETFPDVEGWFRLGLLLIKMGQFNKAREVYEVLLHQTTDESDKAPIYNQLGQTKHKQREYPEALTCYEQSLAIYEKTLPSNHLNLGNVYSDIGLVYDKMGDYPKALSYYEKALAIRQQSLSFNHPDLGDSYNNIGNVYKGMGDYPKALSSHEKALEIRQQSLPHNHPDLGGSYNNIGLVHNNMGNYPKALSSHEKALEIKQQSLPSNHPSLGASHNNIGNVYKDMGDYPKALLSHEKALAIRQQSLSFNHPDLGDSYNNIGIVYKNMGDYPKALSYYEKALTIKQQSLPSNHPDLGGSYNNIGSVYENMGNYAKAHSFYERAVQNGQQSLTSNHPRLQKWRKNLENINKKL
ncbi:unnamed protein product [Adineta steineri]|uniref:Uncharacterized protein n=1 Tax=Adineta steineri TaxID=433720 RepID=A0A819RJF5_9BILA|nr:unnamed protein product [Adineta steineri]CAF4045733.1 unnamed protein product [Adineta steineri]